jgi:hypothetical protein
MLDQIDPLEDVVFVVLNIDDLRVRGRLLGAVGLTLVAFVATRSKNKGTLP